MILASQEIFEAVKDKTVDVLICVGVWHLAWLFFKQQQRKKSSDFFVAALFNAKNQKERERERKVQLCTAQV